MTNKENEKFLKNWMHFAMGQPVTIDLKNVIKSCIRKTHEMFQSCDYLESNFRRYLANRLRMHGLIVHEEVPIIYNFPGSGGEPIPFGHGFADIVVHDRVTNGSIIIELKITSKNCLRQLKKYMKHWKYTPTLFGMTVNFCRENLTIEEYEIS